MYQTFDDNSATGEVKARVALLREWLAHYKLDAFLVPRGDEHRGEYVPPSAERLAWITGFTGSAGFAVVARDSAALFVDGRYTVQARSQVPARLFSMQSIPATTPYDWLADTLKGGDHVIGFDPWLHSVAEIERAEAKLKSNGIRFKVLPRNLVDRAWGTDQPKPPKAPVIVHPTSRAGESASDKVAALQATLVTAGHDATIITAPDSICWLLNIRGSDVAHNPVCLCFAIVPARGKVDLIIDAEKLDSCARDHLAPVAKLIPRKTFRQRLKKLADTGKSVSIDAETCPVWIARQLGGPKKVARAADPCVAPKAIKNTTEIRGARAAQKRDGIAMCRFLAWLDREAPNGSVDEIRAARQLEAFRTETGKLCEISFDTISGSGPNGAIVHYRVTEASNRTLGKGELYLVDSGGQYQDGTTDITRTVAIGAPTEEMRDRFTRVLKGHIAIATATFPEGTRGVELDPLARHALWEAGLDFDHGTGHGVGSYLSVHEGPQSISRRGMVALKPGMIISNEPGYYQEGAYGIRIENLVLVQAARKIDGGDRTMLTFETLTLAPIDRRLIKSGLLSKAERDWLNQYHAWVLDEIEPKLDATDQRWLRKACAKI